MSLDITTLRLLRHRDRFDQLYRSIPERAIGETTRLLLKDYQRYFNETDVPVIDPGAFLFWFKLAHPKLKPEALTICEGVIRQLGEDVDPGVADGLMARLVSADTAAKVADLLTQWNEGAEVDLYHQLREQVETFEKRLDRKVKNPQVLTPIEDILSAEENDTGLHWRLACLNRHIKPLQPGDFGVIAARPDKGKTTFCASELTFMAAQVDALYPGENRSVLWFNNEGPGRRIVLRNFQAALGLTVEECVARSKEPSVDPKWKHRLREDYANALGGRPGVLRVMDIHDMWNHEVEDLIIKFKPALVLFDMIDNIKFGGATLNNGERTDQLLEAMYQWARMMAVKHDCAILATSQVSAEGDGAMYPTLPQLKDSRTGKQGAADLIITIGTNPEHPHSRYIGTTKNKKVRTGVPSSPNIEVRFDGDRGRYVEYQE